MSKYCGTLNFWILLLVGLLSISACKTQKQGAASSTKKKSGSFLLEQLKANQLNYDWFSTKASIRYKDSLNSQNFTSTIRLRKDSIIWLTVKKMGIEGGRALITPDSIRIINRLDKEYYARDFGYLKRAFNLDLDFATLQELIVGNAIFTEDDKAKAGLEGEFHRLTLLNKANRNTFLLDPVSFLIQEMLLTENDGLHSVKMEFEDYNLVDQHQISMERQVFLNSPETGKVKVDMAFSKVLINVPKTTPFVVSNRYTAK